MTTTRSEVTSTFLFGKVGSNFNTNPNAIAPLIIPAIHKKKASENMSCLLCQQNKLRE